MIFFLEIYYLLQSMLYLYEFNINFASNFKMLIINIIDIQKFLKCVIRICKILLVLSQKKSQVMLYC